MYGGSIVRISVRSPSQESNGDWREYEWRENVLEGFRVIGNGHYLLDRPEVLGNPVDRNRSLGFTNEHMNGRRIANEDPYLHRQAAGHRSHRGDRMELRLRLGRERGADHLRDASGGSGGMTEHSIGWKDEGIDPKTGLRR